MNKYTIMSSNSLIQKVGKFKNTINKGSEEEGSQAKGNDGINKVLHNNTIRILR